MKKLLSLFISLLLIPSVVFAKETELKEIISTSDDNTFYESVVSNEDGTYVVVGQSNKDAIVSKFDKDDNLIWTKTYNNGGDIEGFLDVEKYNDGYIVVGFSDTDETGTNALNLILDKDGNKISGDVTEGNNTFYFSDVEVFEDGKYVVVGELDSDAVLFIFDKDGKLLAANKYEANEFSGLTLTSKGTIIAVGRFVECPVIYEIDMNAKALWAMNYRYNESMLPIVDNNDENLGVAFTPNIAQMGFLDVVEVEDGYIAVGSEYASNIPATVSTRMIDFLVPIIVKYDKNGKYLWTKTYNDKEGDGRFADIELSDDGGYYVTGNVQFAQEIPTFNDGSKKNENLGSLSPDEFPILLKVDKDGNYEWQEVREYIGTVNNVEVLNDGSFIAVGGVKYSYYDTVEFANSKSYVLKTKITYSINVNDTDNGKFTAVNENGKADIVNLNDKGIITITPNEGYKLDTVKVVDSKGNEVVVTLENDGTYTYSIYDDTWVTVTFKEIPPIPENPKTGMASYTSILIFVVIIAGIVYFNTRKQNVFKKI